MDTVSSNADGATDPLQDSLVSHPLRPYWSKEKLPRNQQLAWKLAELATDDAPLDYDAVEMVKNRIIDNAGVAIASLNRRPVAVAREMALSCPVGKNGTGALIYGVESSLRVAPAWAAWANGTAVRELDFHDTYLAADYSHPGDNIPPILAVAQSVSKKFGIDGMRFMSGILTAYEVQVALVRAISLHKHAVDHIAHLCPAMAAGIATMLRLPVEVAYQAIQQALHVSLSTRQSRKGEISSWKAFAPAHAGKLAIEAVDRAMRGEGAPSPIYEGEDAIIAQVLDGMDASYVVKLPQAGKPKRSILETYTKEHSAEYQAQALIDLAFDMRREIDDFAAVESILIETSHHTHKVIGTGSGDPQKFDPNASRETLDHSIMYIFAVAMLDGKWHHEDSYAAEKAKAAETVKLWQKISTVEKPEWTKRYHEVDPEKKAFGARVVVKMKNGQTIAQERALANAHPAGKTPFMRDNYVKKFVALTKTLLSDAEVGRFIEAVDQCDGFGTLDFDRLNPTSGAVVALETEGII